MGIYGDEDGLSSCHDTQCPRVSFTYTRDLNLSGFKLRVEMNYTWRLEPVQWIGESRRNKHFTTILWIMF